MKRTVTLGGGTGTFVVLSGLRHLPSVDLTAIVSGADDGGSTGHLRDAYGFLPAGDARQALVALAEDGNVLRELFAYRFGKGNVAGHNLGNLFLTALTDVLGSDTRAIEEASRILRISGRVISATDKPSVLSAVLVDGTVVVGEQHIDTRVRGRSPIQSVCYQESIPLCDEAHKALSSADVVVLGPGDIYTSTAAALLASGTKEVIAASPARLVYILNLFTKAGQTDGYTAQDHIRVIEGYAGRTPDMVFVHEGAFAPDVLAHYAEENEYPIVDDLESDARVIRADLASVHVVPPLPNDPVPRSLVRHDSAKLARALLTLLA